MPTLTAAIEYLPKKQKVMEKSCICNFEPIIKERKPPKSWEDFCADFKIQPCESYITKRSNITEYGIQEHRAIDIDKNLLPDRATAEAILALCQLIQLRNAYNGDWVPNWDNDCEVKYCIDFAYGSICSCTASIWFSLLYFKTEELCSEFLCNFRDLIEKLKPLYGIKGGGEE